MRSISIFCAVALLLSSCKKDDPTIDDNIPLTNGMLVLCEGLYNQNNSTLSWVNLVTGSELNNFFQNTSGRLLGDTGNDMKRYGGKTYVIMTGSSTVEVISGVTGVIIEQIPMVHNSVAKQPRSVAFYEDKIYVSCSDGFVDVIDTTSFEVEERIQVGSNPEGLAVSNGKLYVANSGGLNFPNMDSTVSVVNLATQLEETKITVGLNPGAVEVDAQGDIYVITRGDYGAIPSRMHKINTTTQAVTDFSFDASGITKMGTNFLVSYSDFVAGTNEIGIFDPVSDVMTTPSFLDLSGVQSLYAVSYRPSNGSIYISDAMDFTTTGYVHHFNASGTFIHSYHVGLNPSKIIFYD